MATNSNEKNARKMPQNIIVNYVTPYVGIVFIRYKLINMKIQSVNKVNDKNSRKCQYFFYFFFEFLNEKLQKKIKIIEKTH